MSVWIAFIVVASTAISPQSIDVTDLHVSGYGEKSPTIDLSLKDTTPPTVGKMVGVESFMRVEVPAISVLEFINSDECETAAVQLRKASGVTSVTCVVSGRK